MFARGVLSKWNCLRGISIVTVTILAIQGSCLAQEETVEKHAGKSPAHWSHFVQAGYVWQDDTDTDNGGHFSTNRVLLVTGIAYSPDSEKNFSLSLGYGGYDYKFSGDSGMAGLNPWRNIHSIRLGSSMRWRLAPQWTAFVVPSINMIAEDGADTGDALTGGLMAGFSYRFSDRLTIGPGIGIYNQLEDNAKVLPIPLIRWKITNRLSFDTGGGLGATLGPGLGFNYRLSEKWNLGVNGRFEQLRFRLDNEGKTPNGIGEDSTMSFIGSVTCRFNPMSRISLIVGADLDGTLSLEDEDGTVVSEEDYDTAPFAGLSFSIRF